MNLLTRLSRSTRADEFGHVCILLLEQWLLLSFEGEHGQAIASLSSSGAALLGTADDKRGSRVRQIHASKVRSQESRGDEKRKALST